jgi:fructose-bisphosphate aldolase, class II
MIRTKGWIWAELLVPESSGPETETAEIKWKIDLSTRQEALFLIQGLNAHNILPNRIVLSYGNKTLS